MTKLRINWLILVLMLTGSHLAAASEHSIALDAKIYVAGHRGLVGSALVKALRLQGYRNIITHTSQELDLRDQQAVHTFFEQEKPEYVFFTAAKVGGIKANMASPADFIYDNLAIELNVLHAAYLYGVKKLLFLGSSCIYPRQCNQPMKEEYLLNGPLEPTNEYYAVAKIAGIKLCQAFNRQHGTRFICCMPTNLFGPGDNFNLETAHALPALVAKMHAAKQTGATAVTVWGSGNARREWLYVDDLAQACVFLMNNYDDNEIINIGTGQDISMHDLAYKIKTIVGFEGDLIFDITKPEGMPQKLLNVEKATTLGWHATTDLDSAIRQTYLWYEQQVSYQRH